MYEIGIAGTFDVRNYGDLLFPLIAEAELGRRIGPVALHRFSYTRMKPPDWPYEVEPVAELADRAGPLDGMLIGGGHLIRFDKNIAPGYGPPDADVHHPTGFWLMPALFALQRGCPLMWNAPGGAGPVPGWARPLLRFAVGHSSYVAVRDQPTRDALVPFADGRVVNVVPDTCFGVSRTLDPRRPSAAYAELRTLAGLTRPYIVVQASAALYGFARFVARHRERFAGYDVVSLPIGPALGDGDAPDFADFKRLPFWPEPLLIAELIAGASAVVGVSLHLAITALSFGLPVFRPQNFAGGKYGLLQQYAGTHSFPSDGAIDPEWFETVLRTRPGTSDLSAALATLDRHWDSIAACISDRKPPAKDAFLPYAQRLPGMLEQHEQLAAELDRARQLLDERSRAITGRDEQIAARDAQIAARDQLIAARDATINARDATIGQLTAALTASGHLIEAAKADLLARNAELLSLYRSNSWRVTMPLRRLATLLRAGRAGRPIIRLKSLAGQKLNTEPYRWAFANGLFTRADRNALAATYPRDHFKTVKGYDGEKGYEYEARPLISLGTRDVAFYDDLSAEWRRLARDLLSAGYRAAVSKLTGCDLMSVPMEAYVCHFGNGAWLGPHVDLKAKIMTHVFYFNDTWNTQDGGCLSILRSANAADSIAEVSPVVGNSSVLVRADNSWHAVSRVRDGVTTSRRSMNVIFYHPGAVSTMWPPGDATPLHTYTGD